MSNKAERRNRLSRRDFGRYLLAASVASAICRQSSADIAIDSEYLRLDTRCKNSLKLLGPWPDGGTADPLGTKIGPLMKDNLVTHLPRFIDNAAFNVQLKALLLLLQKELGTSTVTLQDYYVNSRSVTTVWTPAITAIMEALALHIQVPWLVLRDDERPTAGAYITNIIRDQGPLLGIELYAFWIRGRNAHLNYNTNKATWLEARQGWPAGVWAEIRTPKGVSFTDTPNKECWNGSQCIPGDDRDYCEEDNGDPTSSTDNCS